MTTYFYEIGADVLDYIRRVLGTRPYDEVVNVVSMLERGRVEQDKQQTRQSHPSTFHGQRT